MKRGPIARFSSSMKQKCSSCEKWKLEVQSYTSVSRKGELTFTLAMKMDAPFRLGFHKVYATIYISESQNSNAKTELFGCQFYPNKQHPRCI